MIVHRIVAVISRPVVRVLFRPEVLGREHLPRAGGFVLAANHVSGFDAFALSYALFPRAPRNMGKNQLFARPLLGPIIRSLGAFPAHPDGDGRGGAATAAALAAAGSPVVIFPAGARRRQGDEHRLRTGAARAALEAGVPLIPAAIRGTDGWRRLRKWRIAVAPPLRVDDLRGGDPRKRAREATERLWPAIRGAETVLDRDG